jgi:hypothetical protein
MTAFGCSTVEINPPHHSIKQREKCGLEHDGMELNRFAVSAKHQRSGAPDAARRLPQGLTKKSQNNPMQSRRPRLANLVLSRVRA